MRSLYFPGALGYNAISMEKKTGTTRKIKPSAGKAGVVYAALTRITEAVNRSRNLQELFRAIHGIVAGLMPAKNFFIAFKETDEKGDEFVSFPFFKDESDAAPTGRVPLKRSFTGHVIRTGLPLLADDKTIRRLVAAGKVERSLGTNSAIWLGVPLRTKDKTIGAVVVQSYDRRDEYGESEKQILSFISGQIAIAIELMRYREKLEDLVRQRTHELSEEKKVQDVLFEISQAIHSTASLKDFLGTVQKKIGQLMDARNFYVALYDPETGKYSFPFSADEFDHFDPYAQEDLPRTLTDYVRKKGPLLADHAVHTRLIQKGEVAGVTGTDSQIWLGIPLRVPGKRKAIGVMAVQSYTDQRSYTDKEKKILLNVSTTVALAIDRISLISDLFHHFNNAVTSIHGNAEILLGSSEKEAAWLERLDQYIRRYAEQGEWQGGPEAKAELQQVIRLLSQARENSENRIGKIIEGVEDAARRMNAIFTPLMHNDPAGNHEPRR